MVSGAPVGGYWNGEVGVPRWRRKPMNREERERRDREETLGRMRDLDVARGRLESWSGGRVKPLINERDE